MILMHILKMGMRFGHAPCKPNKWHGLGGLLKRGRSVSIPHPGSVIFHGQFEAEQPGYGLCTWALHATFCARVLEMPPYSPAVLLLLL